jgi:hypothetical protein
MSNFITSKDDIDVIEKSLIKYGGDGFTAREVFRSGKTCAAYTYDDLILMPGFF